MKDLSKLYPEPHPTREIFKTHAFPVAAVARHLSCSYNYTRCLLKGLVRVTPSNDLKLRELADLLETSKT